MELLLKNFDSPWWSAHSLDIQLFLRRFLWKQDGSPVYALLLYFFCDDDSLQLILPVQFQPSPEIFHELFWGQKPGFCNLVMHLPDLLLNQIKLLQQPSLHEALQISVSHHAPGVIDLPSYLTAVWQVSEHLGQRSQVVGCRAGKLLILQEDCLLYTSPSPRD